MISFFWLDEMVTKRKMFVWMITFLSVAIPADAACCVYSYYGEYVAILQCVNSFKKFPFTSCGEYHCCIGKFSIIDDFNSRMGHARGNICVAFW